MLRLISYLAPSIPHGFFELLERLFHKELEWMSISSLTSKFLDR